MIASATESPSALGSRARVAALAAARVGVGLGVTLACLLLVTFALANLSPVDPALRLVGDHASASAYQAARRDLGLDEPLPVRFGHYLVQLAHGDLGTSTSTGQPVAEDLARVVPATVELATLAMLLAALAATAAGVAAARRPAGLVDRGVRFAALLTNSVPGFWLGLIALYVFYAHLQIVGGPGRLDDAYEYSMDPGSGFVLLDAWRSGLPGAVPNALAHLVLPVCVLATSVVGMLARLTRGFVVAELGQEYVTLARAKGCTEGRVLWRHVLPNVAGPLVTALALAYARLLEGAVLTETVFAWPGLGRYLSTAVFAGDTPAILGATLVVGFAFAVLNRVADATASTLDPRSR